MKLVSWLARLVNWLVGWLGSQSVSQ